MDLLKSHGKSFTAKIKGSPVKGKMCVEDEKVYLCQDRYDGHHGGAHLGYTGKWCISWEGKVDPIKHDVTDLEILTDLRISIEEARGLLGFNPELDNLILGIWTKEELGDSLEWKNVIAKLGIIDGFISDLTGKYPDNYFKREKYRAKWLLISLQANGDWNPDYKGAYWYVWKNAYGEIKISYTTSSDFGMIPFKSEELCKKAYEANKELVEKMFK